MLCFSPLGWAHPPPQIENCVWLNMRHHLTSFVCRSHANLAESTSAIQQEYSVGYTCNLRLSFCFNFRFSNSLILKKKTVKRNRKLILIICLTQYIKNMTQFN